MSALLSLLVVAPASVHAQGGAYAIGSCLLSPGNVSATVTTESLTTDAANGGTANVSDVRTALDFHLEGPVVCAGANLASPSPVASTRAGSFRLVADGVARDLTCGTGTVEGTLVLDGTNTDIGAKFGLSVFGGVGYLVLTFNDGGSATGVIDLAPTSGSCADGTTSFIANGSFSTGGSGAALHNSDELPLGGGGGVPMPPEPSAICQAQGGTRLVDEHALGSVDAWVFLWQPSGKVNVCVRLEVGSQSAGGRLEIDSGGSLGIAPVVDTTKTDLSPCTQQIHESGTLGDRIYTTPVGANPASICITIAGTSKRIDVGTTSSPSSPLLRWTPDTGTPVPPQQVP